jgi:RpiR family carbohydrate utilization transcriptional regulator
VGRFRGQGLKVIAQDFRGKVVERRLFRQAEDVLQIETAFQVSERTADLGVLQANENRVIVLAPSGTPLADMATVLIPIDLIFATDPYTPISARLAYLVVIDVLAVGLALQRGPEFRRKMQNAQKALQEFEVQFDSFIG